jgi:hypothetical protein
MDTVSGVQGNTQSLSVAQFSLTGAGRSQQVFTIPNSTIAKLVRLRPAFNSDLRQFKFWKFQFHKEDYPADSLTSTPWSNEGYPCDKVFKAVTIQVDTGGVTANVLFQVDGVTATNFNVTTTEADRDRIISLPTIPNIIGRQWRIVPTPGTGGKFQMFGIQVKAEREPCAIAHFDSLEQSFGFNGWKYIKQIWIEYQCPVPIIFSVYRDSGELFFQQTLPAHSNRDVERFYLPAKITQSGIVLFNKSKVYRFMLDTSDGSQTLKMYRDASRVETRQLDGDQRSGYEQHVLWEGIPLAS